MTGWLETVTLAQWRSFDATGRLAVTDALLERLPREYVFTTHTGMMPGPVPQLIHTPTLVTFNLIFGGTYTFGMTPERKERALAEPEDIYGTATNPSFSEPREVTLPAFLLADAPLLHAQLLKLGLHVSALIGSEVRATSTAELTAVLAKLKWRLPSEEEYEHALRGFTDEPYPRRAPQDEHPLALQRLGVRELCSGDVMRGGGPLIDRRPRWFTELLWPGRWRNEEFGRGLVRPAADLPPP